MDTHAATHTYAQVAATTGAVLDHAVFPTTTAGLSRAQDWITRRSGDRHTLVVVEGTGSYGAIVTGRSQSAGMQVVEAARMPGGDRRGTGKSDELDATRIARGTRAARSGPAYSTRPFGRTGPGSDASARHRPRSDDR